MRLLFLYFQVDSDGQEDHFKRRVKLEQQKSAKVKISESRFEHQRKQPLGHVQQQRDAPRTKEPGIRNQFDAGHALRAGQSGRRDGLQDQGSLPQSGRLSVGRFDLSKRSRDDVTKRIWYDVA